MIELNFETALRLAKQAVSEKPEGYIYTTEAGELAAPEGGPSCSNWHYSIPGDYNSEMVPGCIVGTVLHMAGVPLEGMSRWADVGSLRGDLVEMNDPTYVLLSSMQMLQDKGTPWAEAVKKAEIGVRKHYSV